MRVSTPSTYPRGPSWHFLVSFVLVTLVPFLSFPSSIPSVVCLAHDVFVSLNLTNFSSHHSFRVAFFPQTLAFLYSAVIKEEVHHYGTCVSPRSHVCWLLIKKITEQPCSNGSYELYSDVGSNMNRSQNNRSPLVTSPWTRQRLDTVNDPTLWQSTPVVQSTRTGQGP